MSYPCIVPPHAACTNPSTIPAGFSAPCSVFSLSASTVTQAQTLTLAAAPQASYDYIYTTAYVSNGSTWTSYTLAGNNAYPSYSSAQASLTLSTTQLSSLSLGIHYAVVWDWLWDPTAQCYKGPGLNQCNTGQWRVQEFTFSPSVTPTPTPSITPTPTPTLTPTPTPTPSPTPSGGTGCSGSGTSWSCTAGSTSAQIQTAVDSASDGATITLANGGYSLSSEISLDNRNGITIICATVRRMQRFHQRQQCLHERHMRAGEQDESNANQRH